MWKCIFDPMKVFTFLMAVLMFLAGFDLCKEDEGCSDKEKTELTAAGNRDGGEQKSPCTPFCNCARCPFSIVVPANGTKLIVSIMLNHKVFTISTASPIDISDAVWQPPKSA